MTRIKHCQISQLSRPNQWIYSFLNYLISDGWLNVVWCRHRRFWYWYKYIFIKTFTGLELLNFTIFAPKICWTILGKEIFILFILIILYLFHWYLAYIKYESLNLTTIWIKKTPTHTRVKMLIKRVCKSSRALTKFVFIRFLKFKINVNKY